MLGEATFSPRTAQPRLRAKARMKSSTSSPRATSRWLRCPAGGTRSTLLPRDESAVSRELVRNATVAARLLAAFASTSACCTSSRRLALRDSPGDNVLMAASPRPAGAARHTRPHPCGSVVYCLANATKVQEAMQDVDPVSTRTVAASTRQLRHAAALTQAAFACAREREVEIARTKQAGLDLAAHLMTTGSKGRRQDRHGRARLSPVT